MKLIVQFVRTIIPFLLKTVFCRMLVIPSFDSSVDAAYLLPPITGACFSFANKGPPQLV